MSFVNTIVFTVVIASIIQSTWVNGRVISPLANTIKAQNGDVYDCVDFYKQPAFQHPLLKNHSFNSKMEPISTPKWIDGEANTKNTEDLFFGLKDGGCPFGTVPIRRVAKEQRDRATEFSSHLGNSSFSSNALPTDPGIRFAISQSKSGPASPNFYGVGAKFGVLNPSVTPNQFSSAQCMIKNGPDYIQFGWTVNPSMYKDMKTRLFIRTEAGTTHCYNTDCPGFIIVRTDLPLDAVLPKYTSPDEFVMVTMEVFRDPSNGNWWLSLGNDRVHVGFWPGKILSNLAGFGTYIECGGEGYSPEGSPDGDPDIGTGKNTIGTIRYDAYVEKFTIVNDKFERVAAQDTETFVTSDKYNVHDFGILKDVDHTFVYGGPRY